MRGRGGGGEGEVRGRGGGEGEVRGRGGGGEREDFRQTCSSITKMTLCDITNKIEVDKDESKHRGIIDRSFL